MWLDALYGIDLDLYVKVLNHFHMRRDSIDGPRNREQVTLKVFLKCKLAAAYNSFLLKSFFPKLVISVLGFGLEPTRLCVY